MVEGAPMLPVPPPGKAPKKARRKKDKATPETPKATEENEKLTCTFADNTYTGILRRDSLGVRCMEAPAATYTWKSGVRYEGPFVQSHIEGRGKFIWTDGSTYEGEVSNGKRHGQGLYMAADGVTRYEGQWYEGKRHGHGKLSYGACGESYYVGQWADGCKHGEGRQVWPSTNEYEGQWRLGRMSGQGTMLWRDGDVHEQYCGHWEDDRPQGTGTHTWQTPAPKFDESIKQLPLQQMNNNYAGEWDNGVRHGTGTFSYANGARYTGSWVENAKQGEGQYTFEDGRVYSGPFANDQMAEHDAPVGTSLNRPALNIGAEDNPVRRCIDISDLIPFARPLDVGAEDLDASTGVQQAEEVMREVHNMLLRYLGELKQLYARYRLLLRRPGEDPFVLSMHQLWLLSRDLDLVTPSCPLSRLNRVVLCGSRHQQEVAYDDCPELRPLTPRLVDASSPTRRAADNVPVFAESGASSLPARAASGAGSVASEGSDVTSSSSRASPTGGNPDVAAGEGVADQAQFAVADKLRHSAASGDLLCHPPYTKFWRAEGSKDLADIHAPSNILLFRHFVECIVRISLARYPNEHGLEHSLRRLFKERILPQASAAPVSERLFDFLADVDMQRVLGEFEPALWDLFKENAAGEGAYARPQWWIEAAETLPPPREARRCRRGFGGQHRRVHVRARLDATVRVKDVLHIFDGLGFLQPLAESPGALAAAAAEPHGPLFPRCPASAGRPMSEAASEGMAPIPELRGLRETLLGGGTSVGDQGQRALASCSLPDSATEEEGPEATKRCTSNSQGHDLEADEGVSAAPADVLQSDLTISFHDMLRLLVEVLPPESVSKLRWSRAVDHSFGAPPPQDEDHEEIVSLLDYLETEVSFVEFEQLLVRVALQRTREAVYEGQMPPERRVEGFLRLALLPALHGRRYVPPAATRPVSTAAEISVAAERPEGSPGKETPGGGEASQEPLDEVPAAGSPDDERGTPPPSCPPMSFWRGFDDGDLEEVATAVPRCWLAGYELEAQQW